MEAIQLPGDEKNKIWIFYRAIRAKKRRVVHWVEMGDRNGAILRAQADQPINALPCVTNGRTNYEETCGDYGKITYIAEKIVVWKTQLSKMKSYYIEMPLFFPFQSSFKKFFFSNHFWPSNTRPFKRPGEAKNQENLALLNKLRC